MRINHELMALHSLLLISSSICWDKFKRFTLMYEMFFWIVSNLYIEDRRWKMGLFYGWYESTNTFSSVHIRQRKQWEQWTSNIHSIKKSVWVIPSKNQFDCFFDIWFLLNWSLESIQIFTTYSIFSTVNVLTGMYKYSKGMVFVSFRFLGLLDFKN